MSTSDVTTLMSALQTSSASGVKRVHAEIDNSQSFHDYLEQNRSRESVRSRPASESRHDRQDSVERGKNNEARSQSRAEAGEVKNQPQDKQQVSNEMRGDKTPQGSESTPNTDTDTDTATVAATDTSSVDGEEKLEAGVGVFVLKSVDAEFVDNSSELGFKSGQTPLQLDPEALLEPASGENVEAALAGIQMPTAVVSATPVSNVGTSNANAAAAAAVSADAKSPALELEVADGVDMEIEAPLVAKKGIGSALPTDSVNTVPKSLADIKAGEITKLDGSKVDIPVSPAAVKATIEHAQGTSGLNHSYLTDRNASVQGRAIMQSPMMAKQWDTEMAEKVAWFAAKNISSAEIRLDPPELGSLHIRINVNHEQGQVQLNFVSPHANVRDALDQSANRLREMFDEQGMDLVDVDVSSQQQDDKGEQAENALAGGGSEDELVEQQEVQQLTPLSNSLVDSYA